VIPGLEVGVDRAEAGAARALRRDRGIVDQRVQFAAIDPLLDLGDGAQGVLGIGEIDLDVVLGAGAPTGIAPGTDAANR
jgi:hypothetical protein